MMSKANEWSWAFMQDYQQYDKDQSLNDSFSDYKHFFLRDFLPLEDFALLSCTQKEVYNANKCTILTSSSDYYQYVAPYSVVLP